MQSRHPNRKSNSKRVDPHEARQKRGEEMISNDRSVAAESFKLAWFKPTETQKDIIHSVCVNDLTAVQGSSGCGKSTTAIFHAISELRSGRYKHIYFIKTPSEDGDDKIGYLSGDSNQKLAVHFESMRSIFYQFMSKEKLAMEEKRERIIFSIPNFIAGKTLDNCLIIIDEGQKLSPNTMKLLLERTGEGSKVIILGDKHQNYARDKRVDGFTDFVNRITCIDEETEERYSVEGTMGYVEMTAKDNMRSALSRRVVELYGG